MATHQNIKISQMQFTTFALLKWCPASCFCCTFLLIPQFHYLFIGTQERFALLNKRSLEIIRIITSNSFRWFLDILLLKSNCTMPLCNRNLTGHTVFSWKHESYKNQWNKHKFTSQLKLISYLLRVNSAMCLYLYFFSG